jgi:hypothetical protein
MDDDINIIQNDKIFDCNKKCYNNTQCKKLKILYLIGIIIWVLIVYFASLYKLPYSYLLILPIILFCFTISNGGYINYEVESEIARIIYFPMVIVLSVNVYNWIIKDPNEYTNKLCQCIFISLISLLLSSIDIWTDKKWIFIIKHSSSILETYAIILLSYVIIIYGLKKNSNKIS